MHSLSNRYLQLCSALARHLSNARCDDRGEVNASVAWTGLMVLLAVSVAGVIAAKASGFAQSIDFGG